MRLEDFVFATIMLPLLGGALALGGKLIHHHKALAKTLEYTGAAIGLLLPWVGLFMLAPVVHQGTVVSGIVGDWYAGVGISFRFDGLAWLIQILGFTIGLAAYVYSLGGGPRGPAFTSIFLIQTAALAATIITTDLFNLFVCLEVMGITSYVLIPTSKKPGASLAAFSYLMVSASAMVFFLIGTYGLYRITGSLSYEGIAEGLQSIGDAERLVSLMSLALLVSAIAIRVAVMPLYGWLPDAHALAPHAVSAVLSGVLIKTPLFALSRILGLFASGSDVGHLMSMAGGVTALVAVVIALSQKDAKRLLAYHSISQIGYVVAAWGMAIQLGSNTALGISLMAGAYLHALFHAVFKGLLFLSVGTTIDITGERNVYALRSAARTMKVAGERLPVTFITFLIGALAISALPPLNGFVSKNTITYAMKDSSLHHLLVAAGVGTVASFIKLSRIYLPGKARTSEHAPACRRRVKRVRLTSRWIAQISLAILCIAGGLWTPRIMSFVSRLLHPDFQGSLVMESLYARDNLLKTLWTTIGGILVYLSIQTSFFSKVLHIIQTRPRNFKGLFVSFSLGTAGLALWLLI